MTVSRPRRFALRSLFGLMFVWCCAGTLSAIAEAPKDTAEAPKNTSEASKDSSVPAEPVTYCKHIAPILWENCAICHRPGEVGPFSLLTYKDAVKRALFLQQVTHDRLMPPWKPAQGMLAFHDERRLTEDQLALIASWVAAGAPEGDPADLPERPTFHKGWQLGEPDLVVKMSEAFQIPADGPDINRCFVIPLGLSENKMVSAVEFRPGNRGVVHHSIMFLDAHQQARKLDGQDGQPGYRSYGGAGVKPTGGLGVWVPGIMMRHLPDGMAKYVHKGSDLVLQVHYHPTGKPETDQSSVGIYFAKGPTKHIVTGIAVTQPLLVLPAGKAHCDVKTRCAPLPVDVNVLGISPHMHDLGREFRVMARLPNGKNLPLIWIKDWDFAWQGTYTFAEPLRLPKGTVICLHAIYDNSKGNPKNPHDPPQEVRWGDQASDEMCLCGVQVYTDKPEDLVAISKMPGYELAVGLEGGIPQFAEATEPGAVDESGYPVDGIPIFADRLRQLMPYDRDRNGRLSKRELARMSGPMQFYVIRRYMSAKQ